MENKEQGFFKKYIEVFKKAVFGFINEDCLKYSASLSYYTIFSIGPILVLMISLAGIFFGEDAIQGKVFSEMRGLVGPSAAKQIQEVIMNLKLSGKSNLALIVSIITLLIGATTVFGDIQNSINRIWHVRAKPKRGWLKLITDRLLSSSLVVGLGFLLMVTLVVNGIILAFTDQLQLYFPDLTVFFMDAVNFALSFTIIFILFGIIFRTLPDVKIEWKTVRVGAFFTAILFVIGRYGIGLYLQSSGTESTYGAAGALVLVLLWVYYTAAILYFGAVYTREFAVANGIPIKPADYAVYVEEKERERVVNEIPASEVSADKEVSTS